MRFFSDALRGDLILIKTRNTPGPARPQPARSAPATESLLVRLVLWLCVAIGRPTLATIHKIRNAWPPITYEELTWLRIGTIFLLIVFGSLAANIAAKGG